MKKISILILITLFLKIEAQVKVGANPTTINNGVMLELESDGNRAVLKLATLGLTSLSDRTIVGIPASANGTMVYHTGTNNIAAGVYYWNGLSWVLMSKDLTNSIQYGDVKYSIIATDQEGWVKLDGRAITTLTPTQQVSLTSLGIEGNLPDATNSVLMQNYQPLGSVTGSNSKTILQQNLPNVTLRIFGEVVPTNAATPTGDQTVTVENNSGNTYAYYINVPLIKPSLQEVEPLQSMAM